MDIKKLIGTASRENTWWENNAKTEQKWKMLQHNGMYFPESYEPLPPSVKILYKGKPVSLDRTNVNNPFNISSEEAAVYFAQMVDRDERLKDDTKRHRYSEDEKFRNNFWNDWKTILKSDKSSKITDFAEVDFGPIAEFLAKNSDDKKMAKQNMSKEAKEEEKKGKKNIEEIYGYALVDGIKIRMDYMVEVPGLYQGHGQHPSRGKIKKRLEPSDVIINCSKKLAPKCMSHGKQCKWGEIVEKTDVTWIASWKNPITNRTTYKGLNRIQSHFVAAGDLIKFEKARKLDKGIVVLRKKYMNDLNSKSNTTRQLATAVYLLDMLAIRPGADKDEDKEAGTLGLTTLKCSNVKFEKNNHIVIDFVGKSSIQFVKKFQVDERVYSIMKDICASKSGMVNLELFPLVTAVTLNVYLKSIIPDLTAKVFRTWKASTILQNKLLESIPNKSDPVHVKKLMYNKVNIEVAKALNHKRMSSNDAAVAKTEVKLKELVAKKEKCKTEKQQNMVQKSIDICKSKLEEIENNISTGTSKVNYLDPRITVSWAKIGDVPIESLYNKTQLAKFIWSMDTSKDWRF